MRLADYLSHTCRSDRRIFVLPDANVTPSLFVQQAIRVCVAFTVPLNLPVPPLPIGRRTCPVLRTAMPVAPVNEYSDLLACERDVDPPPPISRHRNLQPIAQPARLKLPVAAQARAVSVRASVAIFRESAPPGETRDGSIMSVLNSDGAPAGRGLPSERMILPRGPFGACTSDPVVNRPAGALGTSS